MGVDVNVDWLHGGADRTVIDGVWQIALRKRRSRAVGLVVADPRAVVEVVRVERVVERSAGRRVAADRVPRWIGRRPRRGRSAEARVEEAFTQEG